jgi:hypothetical protein
MNELPCLHCQSSGWTGGLILIMIALGNGIVVMVLALSLEVVFSLCGVAKDGRDKK